MMKTTLFGWLAVLALMAVGASTAQAEITSQKPVETGLIPRPAQIWVYDFAATPAGIPDNSELAGLHDDSETPPTAEDIALGEKLGRLIATELVAKLRAMGMSAEHAAAGMKQQVNDLAIRGYLLSFDEGDAKKRVVVGLGKGASELQAAVEGFQVTEQGLRKLGSGTTDTQARGRRTPGAGIGALTTIATKNPVGLLVSTGMKARAEKTGKATVEGRATQTAEEIAAQLKKRFQDQGWIR